MKQETGNKTYNHSKQTSIQIFLDGCCAVTTPMGVKQDLLLHDDINAINEHITDVIWNTNEITLVPTHLLDPQNLHQHITQGGFYAEHNTQIYQHTNIPEVTALWNAPTNLWQQINNRWPHATHTHALIYVINNTPVPLNIYIHLERNIAHIAATNNVSLQTALSAPVNTNEDVLYYAVSTIAQSADNVTLSGDVNNQTIALFRKYYNSVTVI